MTQMDADDDELWDAYQFQVAPSNKVSSKGSTKSPTGNLNAISAPKKSKTPRKTKGDLGPVEQVKLNRQRRKAEHEAEVDAKKLKQKSLGGEAHTVVAFPTLKKSPKVNEKSVKDATALVEEIAMLRAQHAEAENEKKLLKSKVGKLEKDINQTEDLVVGLVSEKNPQMAEKFLEVKKLKQHICSLNNETDKMRAQLSKLKSDPRVSRLGEIEKQSETYYNEVKRLQAELDEAKKQPRSSGLTPKLPLIDESPREEELAKKIGIAKVEIAKAKASPDPEILEIRQENEKLKETTRLLMSRLQKLEALPKTPAATTQPQPKAYQPQPKQPTDPTLKKQYEQMQARLELVEKQREDDRRRQQAEKEELERKIREYEFMEKKKSIDSTASLTRVIESLATEVKRLGSKPAVTPAPASPPTQAAFTASAAAPGTSSASSTPRSLRKREPRVRTKGPSMAKKEEAASKIQSRWRGNRARKSMEDEAREDAAVLIQANWRGHQTRKKMEPELEKRRAELLEPDTSGIPHASPMYVEDAGDDVDCISDPDVDSDTERGPDEVSSVPKPAPIDEKKPEREPEPGPVVDDDDASVEMNDFIEDDEMLQGICDADTSEDENERAIRRKKELEDAKLFESAEQASVGGGEECAMPDYESEIEPFDREDDDESDEEAYKVYEEEKKRKEEAEAKWREEMEKKKAELDKKRMAQPEAQPKSKEPAKKLEISTPGEKTATATVSSPAEQEKAAVKIQSSFWGHATRAQIDDEKREDAAVLIQTHSRSMLARKNGIKDFQEHQKNQAATKIQAVHRGNVARRESKAAQKEHDKDLYIPKSSPAPSNVQMPQSTPKKEEKQETKSPVSEKSPAGPKISSPRSEKSKPDTPSGDKAAAAIKIQSQYRGHMVRETIKSEKREDAAVTIQARTRGIHERKTMAATTIQSNFRGHRDRKSYAKMKAADEGSYQDNTVPSKSEPLQKTSARVSDEKLSKPTSSASTSSSSVKPGPTSSSSSVKPGPTSSLSSVKPGPTSSLSSVKPGPTSSLSSVKPGPTSSLSSLKPGPTSSLSSVKPGPTSSSSVKPGPTSSSSSVKPGPTSSSSSVKPGPLPDTTSSSSAKPAPVTTASTAGPSKPDSASSKPAESQPPIRRLKPEGSPTKEPLSRTDSRPSSLLKSNDLLYGSGDIPVSESDSDNPHDSAYSSEDDFVSDRNKLKSPPIRARSSRLQSLRPGESSLGKAGNEALGRTTFQPSQRVGSIRPESAARPRQTSFSQSRASLPGISSDEDDIDEEIEEDIDSIEDDTPTSRGK